MTGRTAVRVSGSTQWPLLSLTLDFRSGGRKPPAVPCSTSPFSFASPLSPAPRARAVDHRAAGGTPREDDSRRNESARALAAGASPRDDSLLYESMREVYPHAGTRGGRRRGGRSGDHQPESVSYSCVAWASTPTAPVYYRGTDTPSARPSGWAFAPHSAHCESLKHVIGDERGAGSRTMLMGIMGFGSS